MNNQMTLQDYVEKYTLEGHQHHVISLSLGGEQNHIYIHPDGINGDTLDFIVDGNCLRELKPHQTAAENENT